jgi:hypothetical protein
MRSRPASAFTSKKSEIDENLFGIFKYYEAMKIKKNKTKLKIKYLISNKNQKLKFYNKMICLGLK